MLDCGNVATVGYKAWRDEIDERRLIVHNPPPRLVETNGIQELYTLSAAPLLVWLVLVPLVCFFFFCCCCFCFFFFTIFFFLF